jgi:hypothetical protein
MCRGVCVNMQMNLCAVAVVLVSLFLATSRPTIGHINLLFEPYEITIARNPELAFVERLRALIPALQHELAPHVERLMQPHEAYLSHEFAGGVELGRVHQHQTSEPPWDWGILRAGTADTCLAARLPAVMAAVDAALQQSGQRVHTAFLSRLGKRRVLPPHCGETRGLLRIILVLDGPPGVVGRQTVLNEHSACLRRFAKPCPAELAQGDTSAIAKEVGLYANLTTTTVEYAVGDAVVFNDALCHWVEYLGEVPRLALILNVDRTDVPAWRRALLTAISKAYITLKGSKLMRAADTACARF